MTALLDILREDAPETLADAPPISSGTPLAPSSSGPSLKNTFLEMFPEDAEKIKLHDYVVDYNAQNPETPILEADIPDRSGIVGRVSELVHGSATGVADVLPMQLAQAWQGSDVPLDDSSFSERVIRHQQKDIGARVLSKQEILGEQVGKALAQGPQSVATSLATAAGGGFLGAKAGAAIGAGIGAVAGVPAAGAGAAPGAATGAGIGGTVGAMVGAATLTLPAFWRMAENQLLRQWLEQAEKHGRKITPEEWAQFKGEQHAEISKYGFYEAAPEALSAALGAGIFKGVGGKIFGKIPGFEKISKGIAQNTLARLSAKYGGMVAEEEATELATSMGQTRVEANLGLREKPATVGEILKEQGGAVAVGALLQGGGMHAAMAGADRLGRTGETGTHLRPSGYGGQAAEDEANVPIPETNAPSGETIGGTTETKPPLTAAEIVSGAVPLFEGDSPSPTAMAPVTPQERETAAWEALKASRGRMETREALRRYEEAAAEGVAAQAGAETARGLDSQRERTLRERWETAQTQYNGINNRIASAADTPETQAELVADREDFYRAMGVIGAQLEAEKAGGLRLEAGGTAEDTQTPAPRELTPAQKRIADSFAQSSRPKSGTAAIPPKTPTTLEQLWSTENQLAVQFNGIDSETMWDLPAAARNEYQALLERRAALKAAHKEEMDQHFAKKEVEGAKSLRENERPVQVVNVPEGGTNQGGADLQRAAEEGAGAGNARKQVEAAGQPDNPYLKMPMERVQTDADLGVKLAQAALEVRTKGTQGTQTTPLTSTDQADRTDRTGETPGVGAKGEKGEKGEAAGEVLSQEPEIAKRLEDLRGAVMRGRKKEAAAIEKEILGGMDSRPKRREMRKVLQAVKVGDVDTEAAVVLEGLLRRVDVQDPRIAIEVVDRARKLSQAEAHDIGAPQAVGAAILGSSLPTVSKTGRVTSSLMRFFSGHNATTAVHEWYESMFALAPKRVKLRSARHFLNDARIQTWDSVSEVEQLQVAHKISEAGTKWFLTKRAENLPQPVQNWFQRVAAKLRDFLHGAADLEGMPADLAQYVRDVGDGKLAKYEKDLAAELSAMRREDMLQLKQKTVAAWIMRVSNGRGLKGPTTGPLGKKINSEFEPFYSGMRGGRSNLTGIRYAPDGMELDELAEKMRENDVLGKFFLGLEHGAEETDKALELLDTLLQSGWTGLKGWSEEQENTEEERRAEHYKAMQEEGGEQFQVADLHAAPAQPHSWMDATGDVVRGDTIRFEEGVFGGSFRNPKFMGTRVITAEVLNDSYGKAKQQHTFTIRVLESTGEDPLEKGVVTTRKGRNVYRNLTERLEWINEAERGQAADEKHARGDQARATRDVRRGFAGQKELDASIRVARERSSERGGPQSGAPSTERNVQTENLSNLPGSQEENERFQTGKNPLEKVADAENRDRRAAETGMFGGGERAKIEGRPVGTQGDMISGRGMQETLAQGALEERTKGPMRKEEEGQTDLLDKMGEKGEDIREVREQPDMFEQLDAETRRRAKDGIKELQSLGKTLSNAPLSENPRDVDRPSEVETLALSIPRDLGTGGAVTAVGQKVVSPADVAVLCQAFRDPRVETFRILFTQKDKIVHHVGLTSAMVNSAHVFFTPKTDQNLSLAAYNETVDRHRTRWMKYLNGLKARLGADGYILVHNHPGRKAEASRGDVNATRYIRDNLEGFKWHIILDHNEFAWLSSSIGDIRQFIQNLPLPAQTIIDPLRKPGVEHKTVEDPGTYFSDTNSVAEVALRESQQAQRLIVLMADSQKRVQAIFAIPNRLAENLTEFKAWIQTTRRQVGGSDVFASYPSGQSEKVQRTVHRLWKGSTLQWYVGEEVTDPSARRDLLHTAFDTEGGKTQHAMIAPSTKSWNAEASSRIVKTNRPDLGERGLPPLVTHRAGWASEVREPNKERFQIGPTAERLAEEAKKDEPSTPEKRRARRKAMNAVEEIGRAGMADDGTRSGNWLKQNQDVHEAYAEASKPLIVGGNFIQRTWRKMRNLAQSTRGPFPHLETSEKALKAMPAEELEAQNRLVEELRGQKNYKNQAAENAIEWQKGTVLDVLQHKDEAQRLKNMGLFSRTVVVRNMVYEAERKLAGFGVKGLYQDFVGFEEEVARIKLPFNLTMEKLREWHQAIEKDIRENAQVAKALELRDALFKRMADELVRLGLIEPEQAKNPHYFHQIVLEYALGADMAELMGTGGRLKIPEGRSYQKHRYLNAEAYSADVLKVDNVVLSQFMLDILNKRLIDRIGADPVWKAKKDWAVKEAERRTEELKKKYPKARPVTMGDVLEDLPGYTVWAVHPGMKIFGTTTLNNQLMAELVQKVMGLPPGGKAVMYLTKEDLAQGAKGMKYDWYVLPETVAAQLNDMANTKFLGTPDQISGMIEPVMNAWKQGMLFLPTRFVRYNLNNTIGDLEGLIEGAGIAVLKGKESWKQTMEDLWAYFKHGRKSDKLRKAVNGGVLSGTITAGEVRTGLKDMPGFADFYRLIDQDGPTKLTARRMARMLYNVSLGWGKSASVFREGILRYKAFLYASEILEKGGTIGKELPYAASRAIEFKGLSNDQIAAKWSREILVDYEAISAFGQMMRKGLFPFFSWTEGNLKRYKRLFENAFIHGEGTWQRKLLLGSAPARKLAAGLLIWTIGVDLWNWLMLGDDDEAKEGMSKYVKQRGYLAIGPPNAEHEVKYIRVAGASRDLMEWAGAGQWPDVLADLKSGQTNLGQALLTVPKSAANKVVGGLGPAKSLMELAFGKSVFPDVFEPKAIREKDQAFAQMWGLGEEYKWAKNIFSPVPKRGAGDYIMNLLAVKSNDPGLASYNEIMGLKFRFEEKVLDKHGSAGDAASEKSSLARQLRLARRWGDERAESRIQDRLGEIGVRAKDIRDMLERATPLYGLSRKNLRAFQDWLTPEQRRTLERAEAYYQETFR